MRKRGSTEKYRNIWESGIGAACGFLDAIRTEKKVRQVFLTMTSFVAVCFFADVGYFQIWMVLFAWVLAFICEMFNTALEKALDYAGGQQYHPLIREGKDYAAACTFVSVVFAVSLSLFVLWERLR